MTTFKEFLIEARKNPEHNTKKSVLDQLEGIRDQYGNDCYVRYVGEPKLGHNPMSRWNTPFGLCSYPIDYVIENKLRVPYAGKMPYMVIFKPKDDVNVLEIGHSDPHSVLKHIQHGLDKVLGTGNDNTKVNDDSMKDVWYYMYRRVHDYGMANRLNGVDSQSIGMLVRKILLASGYQGVNDPGEGIIHENEPTQAIFFNVKDLHRIDTIRTTFEYDRMEYRNGEEVTIGNRRSNIQTYEWQEMMRQCIRTGKRSFKVEGKAGLYHTREKQGLSLMIAYMKATGYTNEKWVDIIKHEPDTAVTYCRTILNGARWPEAEPYIMKDPDHAMEYANDIIKGRWPEAEPYMALCRDEVNIFDYIKYLMHGKRWPALEKQMLSHERRYKSWIMFYVMNVIRDRWPEAERIINEFPNLKHQYEVFCQNLDSNKEMLQQNAIEREKANKEKAEKMKKWGMAT